MAEFIILAIKMVILLYVLHRNESFYCNLDFWNTIEVFHCGSVVAIMEANAQRSNHTFVVGVQPLQSCFIYCWRYLSHDT